MADLLADSQGAPTTPSSGQVVLYPSTISKQWTSRDDTGKSLTLHRVTNWNTADVVASAADTYLTGSAIAVPPHGLQAGTMFKWRFRMAKTAAGIAAPTWIIRVGTAGTVSDTARVTFTGTAQTAAVDNGYVEIEALLRNTGAAGILTAGLTLQKAAVTAVGLTNTVGGLTLQVNSSGFDTTVASLIVGVSVNPGASGVFTHQLVTAELLNC